MERWVSIFVAMVTVTMVASQGITQETCDRQRRFVTVRPDADLMIAGVFPMRSRGVNGYGCGVVGPENYRIMVYEAARFAVQRINAVNFIPGVTLGLRAYDSCSNPNVAVASLDDFFQESSGWQCRSNSSQITIGAIGGYFSDVTAEIAGYLEYSSIPNIAFASNDLSQGDNTARQNLFRTSAPMAELVEAIIASLNSLKWTRVGVIYTDNDFGRTMLSVLKRDGSLSGICIAEGSSVTPGNANQDSKLQRLVSSGADAIVLAVDQQEVSQVLQSLERLIPGSRNIQIISPFSLTGSSRLLPGAISVTQREAEVPEFIDVLSKIDPRFPPAHNPWFSEWYMRKFRCRLSGNVAPEFGSLRACGQLTVDQRRGAFAGEENHSVYREAIKAVYAYAAAIRQARREKCGTSSGSCPALARMSHQEVYGSYLRGLDYTMGSGDGIPSLLNSRISFDENGDITNGHNFVIQNYNRREGQLTYKQVGNYSSSRLTLDRTAITVYDRDGFRALQTIPELRCTGNQCGQCLSSDELQYWYTPGDVIIVGLTSLHQPGSDPSTCGTLDVENSFRALAFQQSVEAQNDPNSPLTVGSLLVDLCGSEAKVSDFLDRFYTGSLQLYDDSNEPIDPSKVVGTVDMLDDSKAQIVARYAGELKSPVVGAVATDIDLGNKADFPYYSQRVPSDDKEAETIAFFLQNVGWTYIQTVNSPDVYGRLGIAALRKATNAGSVCIAQSIEMETDGNPEEIIRKFQAQPTARVIVIFAPATTTASLFDAARNSRTGQQFVFITTGWSENTSDQTFQAIPGKSFTVGATDTTNPEFEAYVRQLNPRQTDRRFVRELYQSVLKCQVGSVNQACNESARITESPVFNDRIKASTQFVSRAITLIGNNLQSSYSEICDNCGNSVDSVQLKEKLQQKMTNDSSTVNGNFQILGYRMLPGQELTQVAEYSPDSFVMRITPAAIRRATGLNERDARCAGFCGQCSYLIQQHPYIYQPGDILVGALVGIMDSEQDGFTCDKTRLGDGYQHAAAALFALDQINSGDAPVALNNVTIGSLVLDDCNSDDRAVGLVNEIYSGVSPMKDVTDMAFRGWFSHTKANVAKVAANLNAFQTPLLASEASSLGEREMSRSPMLYTTGAILNQRAVALVRMVRSRGYDYFQAIYSPDANGQQGIDILKKVASEEGVCVVKALKLNDDIPKIIGELAGNRAKAVVVIVDGDRYAEQIQSATDAVQSSNGLLFFTMEPVRFNNKPIAKNVISLKLKEEAVPGFMEYIQEKHPTSDGFYRYYYQSVQQCDLPGSSVFNVSCRVESQRNFPTDIGVMNTVNAVYALGDALHKTLQEKCGTNYNGVCVEFRTDRDTNSHISEKLGQVSFPTSNGGNFEFTGRRVYQNFEVVVEETARSVQIGTFNAGRLLVSRADLLQRFSGIKSTCQQPCLRCNPQGFFDHVPGDVYLAGVFNIHYKSVEPFGCGKIKTIFGYQSLEAFKYAIEKVNSKVGQFGNILNGVRLGGLGLDACDSSVRTAYLAANIHNGETRLSKNGTDIVPGDIVGYVAARESDQSKHLNRVLATLDIPQISYGSTSIELQDTIRYPLFARTVPIDDRQTDAVLAFLNKYDLRYVQILRSPTSYGELSSQVFIDKAVSNRICIAQTVTFRDERGVTKESAAEVVTALLENPNANVAVVFADIGYINEFLKAVKRTPSAKGKFLFIGTVSWNRNEVLLEGVEEVAHGSVIINVEKFDIPQFDRYLERKTLSSERENNWFQEYYETIHGCLVTLSDENRINGLKQCDPRHQNIVTSGNYLQDPDVLHVTNAVYAAAYGLDYALKALCGQNYTRVCRQFQERDSRRELMFEGALKARFQDEAFANFQFTDERSGNKGYTLYAIEPTTTTATYNYKDIGRFNDAGLNIRGFETSWNGSCDRQDTCNECPNIRDQTTRVHRIPSLGGSSGNSEMVTPKIVSVFDLHQAQAADEFRCGAMKHQSVLDNVLAFMFTIEMFQKQNFSIGGIVVDSCSRSVRLYPELLSLIRGNGYCGSSRVSSGGGDSLANIMGVVPYGEENSLVANRILTPMSITSVSPNAVSPILSDSDIYPFFLRTKPPHEVEAQAILDLLRKLGWTYVSVIYTGSPRGRDMTNYLLRHALGDGSQEQAICIGASLILANGDGQAIANDHVRTLDEQGSRGSRVAVLLTSPEHSEMMLQGVRQMQPNTKLVLVGMNDWGLEPDAFSALGDYLVNSVSLRTFAPQVPKFLEYKAKLGTQDGGNHGLPNDWFAEFYQHNFQCYLSNATVKLSDTYTRRCEVSERFNIQNMRHDPNVFHTIIATYTIAEGLKNARRSCGNDSLEKCATEKENFRQDLFSSIWEVKWPEILSALDITSAELKEYGYQYTPGRYGNTGYLVYSVVTLPDTGQPVYEKIGRWNGTMMMDYEGNYTGIDGLVVESACYGRLSCGCKFLGGESGPNTGAARWGEEVLSPRNYYLLDRIEKGGRVSYQRVIEWPVWAVIIAILTCIMILVTLFVFIVLLFFYPVRSGTTVLGFMLLIGILGIFLINFAFFVPASAPSCGARRFVMGVVYAICFAALLVKAIDNWRYNWDDYDMGKRKYKGVTSACFLLLLALGLVGIQVLIAVLWLVTVPPGATLVSIAPPPHDFWWCNPPLLYDVGLVLSFIFVIILIIATIIFATISFLKDINHFESRWLLASCLCTAAIFIAWMIISTMAGAPYRDVTIAIANLLNGTILLFFFPLRKIWLMYQRTRSGDNLYETRSRMSDFNMSATEHMEMNEKKRQAEREMMSDRSILVDQSFLQSAHQSAIYSQPRNAGSTLNRSEHTTINRSEAWGRSDGSGMSEGAVAGNLRHTNVSEPTTLDMRKERKTTSVVEQTTLEHAAQNGAARAVIEKKNKEPEVVIVTELLEKPSDRHPETFVTLPGKPYVQETRVKTTKTYRHEIPDDYIPSNLSASYEVDEMSFDPNTQSQRTEWHTHETRTREPLAVPIQRLDRPPSKSRSSSSASSFTSSRLDRPLARQREAELMLNSPLMEFEPEDDLIPEIDEDGKVDRQRKKTTVVETDDYGTTKKTTTVEETSYMEY